MRPRLLAAVCVLLTMIPAPIRIQGEPDSERRWWRVAEVQRHLRLSAAQIDRLDNLFERERPMRSERQRRVAQMERRLTRTMELADADDESVVRLSEAVESLRIQRNVHRTLMLFAMYKTLTPEQRVLLAQMHRTGRGASRRPPEVR